MMAPFNLYDDSQRHLLNHFKVIARLTRDLHHR